MTATTPDDVTLGEVHRTVLAVQSNMNQRFTETNSRFDTIAASAVRTDVYGAEQAHMNTRLTAIEDGLRWFRRQVVGVLISVVLAAAVTGVIAMR